MKNTMVGCNAVAFVTLLVAAFVLFQASTTSAAPHSSSYPGYYSQFPMEGQNPEYILQTIARLRQALMAEEDLENNITKRKASFDFGMGRAYSGNREALLRYALAMASSSENKRNHNDQPRLLQ